MSPQVISDLLFQIFSEEGYSVNGLTVKCQSPLVANIASAGGRTTIDFGNNFPRAEVKKIITPFTEVVFQFRRFLSSQHGLDFIIKQKTLKTYTL